MHGGDIYDLQSQARRLAAQMAKLKGSLAKMTDRFICTAENPFSESQGRACHPDAEYQGDREAGSGYAYALYRCHHCGTVFKEELPQ